MRTAWIVALAALVSATVFGAEVSHAAPAAPAAKPQVGRDGIVKVRSVYGFEETIARLKTDIMMKGIKFFAEIEQSKLAAEAGVKLNPSTLLVFGNPPLGTLFITANALAGLDWPVRLLVFQDDAGRVWTAYTDFNVIARRHRITNREAAFKTASGVIGSITASVAAR